MATLFLKRLEKITFNRELHLKSKPKMNTEYITYRYLNQSTDSDTSVEAMETSSHDEVESLNVIHSNGNS